MAFPAELGSHVHLEDGLLETPLVINDGSLRLPAGPGLGVTLDRERVARYRLWSTDIGELPA
jgi:L-alanine-DL-glutamate epimerase-like enolase superfamily enzyme